MMHDANHPILRCSEIFRYHLNNSTKIKTFVTKKLISGIKLTFKSNDNRSKKIITKAVGQEKAGFQKGEKQDIHD